MIGAIIIELIAFPAMTANKVWRPEAIKRNVAHYDENGKFTWNSVTNR
jgi:hypothetical protein